MQHLVIVHSDGTSAAVPVNTASTLRVQTWRPPNLNSEEPSFPVLDEDQTFSLNGVLSVELVDDAPPAAVIVQSESPISEPDVPVTELSEAEAAAMDSAAVEGVALMPWEDAA